MTTAARFGSSITTFTKRVVLFLTLIGSSLALAQATSTPIQASTDNDDGVSHEKVPYRGTSVSYGHALSAYNYTPSTFAWTHRIVLTPEWHFNDTFHVRGRLYLTQELTDSDSTNHLRELELSDVWLDGVWGGWKEKNSGIKLGADVRVTLPTSKQSQAASRYFTLGPSANLSRTFNVLGGLTLIYSARLTWRFNHYATRQNAGGLITNCAVGNPEACSDTRTGSANIQFDLIHGPTVVFNLHARFNISGSLFMQRGWLPALAATELVPAVPMQTRDFIGFYLGLTYQPFDVVGFTLGAFTFANQLDSEGKTIFPLFNRSTYASLDATFDLEAIVSRITKEKK